ncbi:MAG TPA: hypothetical protein VNN17_07025 [Terriglobia bacterium]|nr:hypothetical protein [Terriglobia bacterium]
MRHAALRLAALVAVLSGGGPFAAADIDFQARKMTRGDVPLGKGQCDIRLRVDGEVEVTLRGDRVHVRTIAGREARDEGSECNEPLPVRPVENFQFEVRDSRGEIKLLSEPERRTGFSAVVRIRDSEGGAGRYHFRISWQMDGGGPGPGPGPGGWPGTRPGGGAGYGGALTPREAIALCSDAVRDRIRGEHGYNNVEIQNPRVDERPGRGEWIIGDARGRSGFSVELFIFSCQVDYNSRTIRALDVRTR